MKKILASMFIYSIFSLLSCYGVDNKQQPPTSEGNLSNGKRDELPSSNETPHQEFIDALAASKKTWENLKKEYNDTYSYQLESGVPGWTPNRYQTVVEVERGSIADYTVKPIEGSINDEMRKHLPAKKTLDELYNECENEIIPNLSENQWFTLDFFSNGVLASCSYDQCGMMDSEGNGIDIKALALKRTKNFEQQSSIRNGRLQQKCRD